MTDQLDSTSAENKANGRRRGQAVAGALAGVAVIAILVAVFVGIQVSDDDTPAAAPAASAATTTDPSAAAPAQPPQPSAAAPQVSLDPALQRKPEVTKGSGTVDKLVVTPLVEGSGPRVEAGQQLTVNYVGVTYADGREFDSSWKAGQPVTFPIGVGGLIKGWDQGLVGVPLGSRVQLDIPPDLAYGENPTGGQPAGALRFVVDLLQAR